MLTAAMEVHSFHEEDEGAHRLLSVVEDVADFNKAGNLELRMVLLQYSKPTMPYPRLAT
jgi:hypothetical protein